MTALAASGKQGLLELVMAATRATRRGVRETSSPLDRYGQAPENGRAYTEMVYQPMLELLAYLRANGFKTFIVSGGASSSCGLDERVYGIPRSR